MKGKCIFAVKMCCRLIRQASPIPRTTDDNHRSNKALIRRLSIRIQQRSAESACTYMARSNIYNIPSDI